MKRLLILALLIAPLFQSCDFFQKKDLFSNNEDSVKVYQQKQDSLKYVDSIRELQQKVNHLKSQHRQLLDSLRNSRSDQPSGGSYKYHVILGSFKNPEYLKSYNQYVQDRGFETTILENQYSFQMVAVESTNSWQKAVRTLEELRKGFEKTAWIYAAKQ